YTTPLLYALYHITPSHPCPCSFFFLTTRPPPRSTLFPYTTLFRSESQIEIEWEEESAPARSEPVEPSPTREARKRPASEAQRPRSEEHTSELQSRSDLVCRLLLEKKKKKEQR